MEVVQEDEAAPDHTEPPTRVKRTLSRIPVATTAIALRGFREAIPIRTGPGLFEIR